LIADGQVVGAASVTLSQVIDSYFCHVNVTPDHRRRGIGMRLYAAVYDLIDPSIWREP
jgi:GNAT superfamily N-acetyltransferase